MDRIHKKLPNPLLFHPEVGLAKPPSRVLPPPEHAFGKENKKDDFGAGIGKRVLFQSRPRGMLIKEVRLKQANEISSR